MEEEEEDVVDEKQKTIFRKGWELDWIKDSGVGDIAVSNLHNISMTKMNP